MLSAVVSSLAFGIAHIVGSDLSSLAAWAQALGKTISSGIFGLALLFLYWKTRNIWACGIVHGLYDFFVGFSQGIFSDPNASHSYVMPDDMAMPVIVVYVVTSVIELFICWRIWVKIGKQIDYQKIREEW